MFGMVSKAVHSSRGLSQRVLRVDGWAFDSGVDEWSARGWAFEHGVADYVVGLCS